MSKYERRVENVPAGYNPAKMRGCLVAHLMANPDSQVWSLLLASLGRLDEGEAKMSLWECAKGEAPSRPSRPLGLIGRREGASRQLPVWLL